MGLPCVPPPILRYVFSLAIQQPMLDMPEVCWKAYIDFEVKHQELDNAQYACVCLRLCEVGPLPRGLDCRWLPTTHALYSAGGAWE